MQASQSSTKPPCCNMCSEKKIENCFSVLIEFQEKYNCLDGSIIF